MKLFQIDAFTNKTFSGNPAAVVPLDRWVDDMTLQAIAAENNLAETAFYVPVEEHWELRWFTPTKEVALCGHATLAAAYVLVEHMGCKSRVLEFETRSSGKLTVTQMESGLLSMSFPAIAVKPSDQQTAVSAALGDNANSVHFGHYSPDQFDYVAVFDSEESVAALTPEFLNLVLLIAEELSLQRPAIIVILCLAILLQISV